MRLACSLFALVVVAASATPDAAHGPAPADTSRDAVRDARVRPYDARSAGLLLEGLRRSDRLRTIVETIEKGNVIAYLQTQPGLKDRLAGTVTWVTATPKFRYVRISLNPALGGDLAIALLAHELQHVVEIAHEPSVVNETSLEAFYRRTGTRMLAHTNGWDTEAARAAGDHVRRELRSTRDPRPTESVDTFDPEDWNTVYRRARDRR